MQYRRLATPPPTEELRGREYYHGTSNPRNFKGIQEKGLIPNFKPNYHGEFSAQEGRAYLTSDIEIAISYAFVAGHNWDFLKGCSEERYEEATNFGIKSGYILVFDGNDLGDVEPDEDKVIEFIHEKKFPWLNQIVKEWYLEKNEYDTYRSIIDRGSWWWELVPEGKNIITLLTPEQRLQICEAGGNIASGGIIHPVSGWKLSTEKVGELNRHGTNFFELAEWIF